MTSLKGVKAVFLGIILALLLNVSFWSPALGEDLTLNAAVVMVENIDGENIVSFRSFTAFKDDTTFEGASGRYYRDSETFEAFGSDDIRVTAVKRGDDAFTLSAATLIQIMMNDDRLRAEGDVRYDTTDSKARSFLLVVDTRDAIRALIDPLLADISDHMIREVILGFFERTSPDDRLVFLQNDVSIDQDDISLIADWVIFNESQTDDIISVASADRKVELRLTTSSDNVDVGDADVHDND